MSYPRTLIAMAGCALLVVATAGCISDAASSGTVSGSGGGGGSSGPGALTAAEVTELNTLRSNAYIGAAVTALAEDPNQDTEAIHHTGYLAAATTSTDYLPTPSIETNGTNPLFTTVTSGTDNTLNRLLFYSGGTDPANVADTTEEIYVGTPPASFLGDPVLTAYYSRIGRLPFIRNQATSFGWGSTTQAHALNALAPVVPTTFAAGAAPLNGFSGTFTGSFMVLNDSTQMQDAQTLVPSSQTTGSMQSIFGFSTDTPATGFPISISLAGGIGTIDSLALKYDATGGTTFVTPSPAIPVRIYTSGGTTPAAVSGITFTAVADNTYLGSEVFIVPTNTLASGSYSLVASFNGTGTPVSLSIFFIVHP